jgi:hypothetical protein
MCGEAGNFSTKSINLQFGPETIGVGVGIDINSAPLQRIATWGIHGLKIWNASIGYLPSLNARNATSRHHL